jgi:hypothetical protein
VIAGYPRSCFAARTRSALSAATIPFGRVTPSSKPILVERLRRQACERRAKRCFERHESRRLPCARWPEIRAAIGAFDGEPGTGLIVLPDPIFGTSRSLIFELAAKQHHPTIYPFRSFAQGGGLLSYGINILDQVRRSAFYVDRILKGAAKRQASIAEDELKPPPETHTSN